MAKTLSDLATVETADALKAARDHLEGMGVGVCIYGGFHGGDPRDFSPDPEASTEEERARHKAACEAWDRGENPEHADRDCEMEMDRERKRLSIKSHVGESFGLGTYQSSEDSQMLYVLWRLEDAIRGAIALARPARQGGGNG